MVDYDNAAIPADVIATTCPCDEIISLGPGEALASVDFVFAPLVDLYATVVAGVTTVSQGHTIEFTITAGNYGPGVETGPVTVELAIGDGFEFIRRLVA